MDIICTREHLKSAHGTLTVGDHALLDYLHSELYGVHPGQVIVDPTVRGLVESFGQKVTYSKLNVGAKTEAQSSLQGTAGGGGGGQAQSDKLQRKARLDRQAAAKQRKKLLADAAANEG